VSRSPPAVATSSVSAAGRRDLVVSADAAAIRTGSALSINQVI
jgi:hypothetical protein